jgi:flagellar motor protein MotB
VTRRRIATPNSLRASGDRWLFGYADVVTLLFACFAALYAAQVTPAASADRTPVAPTSAAAGMESPLARDINRLSALDASLQMELTPIPSGIVVSMPESGTFAPGRAELSATAERANRGSGRNPARPAIYGSRRGSYGRPSHPDVEVRIELGAVHRPRHAGRAVFG